MTSQAHAQNIEDLRHDLDSLFHNSEFSNATFGVAIQSLKTGEYLYRLDDTKSLVPASNMKLFTTAEAITLLGPQYKFKTEFLTNGTVKRKTLLGDLILRGGGDPTFNAVAAPLYFEHNIQRIIGRLEIDNSYFTSDIYPVGWQVDDLHYGYATPISSLSLNENQVTVSVEPGKAIGDPAVASFDELQPPYGVLVNLAKTVSDSDEETVDVARKLGTDTIIVSGAIRLNDDVTQEASVQDPIAYTTAMLHDELLPTKFLTSKLRNRVASKFHVILQSRSRPLSAIVDTMDKNSDNFYAECLFRTVAKEIGGEGSWTRGIQVMRKYLATIGIDTLELQFTDGSGLSRMDLVTADDIVTLLRAMASNPKLDSAFYNSLPIMGVDGTLENQMKGTPAQGNVHAKTGSMTGVRAISGYLTTRDGESIAFSILANNYTVSGSEIGKLEDEVLLKLVNFSRTR